MRPSVTKEGIADSIGAYETFVKEQVEGPFNERKKELFLDGKEMPCGKGCTKCCELMVTVCPPDALRIARYLRANNMDTHDLRHRLIGETEFAFDCAKGKKTDEEIANEYRLQRRNCVFLDDGGCSVYEARPVVCRLFNTLGKAEDCMGEENDKQTRIVTEDLRKIAADRGVEFGRLAWGPEHGMLPEMVLWALEELDRLEAKS